MGTKVKIICIQENTTNKDYGLYTDKRIVIAKDGHAILLEPEDLRELERVVGAKFKS